VAASAWRAHDAAPPDRTNPVTDVVVPTQPADAVAPAWQAEPATAAPPDQRDLRRRPSRAHSQAFTARQAHSSTRPHAQAHESANQRAL